MDVEEEIEVDVSKDVDWTEEENPNNRQLTVDV